MTPPHSDSARRAQACDGFVDAPSSLGPISRTDVREDVPDVPLAHDPVARRQAWTNLDRDYTTAYRNLISSLKLHVQLLDLQVKLKALRYEDEAKPLLVAARSALRGGEYIFKRKFMAGLERRCDSDDFHYVVDEKMVTPRELLRDVEAKLSEANGLVEEELRGLRRYQDTMSGK